MAIDAVLRKAGRRSAMLTGGSLLVLAALATLFRMPQFINSDTVNSDSAIVGLQAIELLRGADWSWFLWGTGYQSSLDPLLTAVAFAAFGTSSLVLMAVNFLGALLAMSLCFSMLQARVGAARAFVLTLLLVFVSQPMVLITTLPPRQWSITAFFLAIALADRAAHGRAFARVMLGVSGALMCLALYIDYGPVQFFLPSVWLLFASCRDQTPDSRARAGRMWSAAIGLAVGSLFLIGSRLFLHPEGTVPIAFKPRVVGHNVDMLFTQALPSLMGYSTHFLDGTWPTKTLFTMLGIGLLVMQGLGGWIAWRHASVPSSVRKLGLFGVFVSFITLLAFSGFPKVLDAQSSRFLTPIIWAAPFALLPLVCWLPFRRFTWIYGPCLALMAVGGWIGFYPAVVHLVPVRTAAGQGTEERALGEQLRQLNVHHATAPFWISYRLTFLVGLDPLVVPTDPTTDRHPAYRKRVDEAATKAEIFHRDWEQLFSSQKRELELVQGHVPYQKITRGAYVAFIVKGPRD